jgi:hypothetical protein
MSLLQSYKSFVRAHPGLVLNAERLLHWVVWNPERFSGSEYAYEGFNAIVGLLGIYNESILTEHPDYNTTVAKYAFWLAAVEQVGLNIRFSSDQTLLFCLDCRRAATSPVLLLLLLLCSSQLLACKCRLCSVLVVLAAAAVPSIVRLRIAPLQPFALWC